MHLLRVWASLVAHLVKNPPAAWETWVQSLSWEDPLRTEQLPTPVFWPGEFHGLYCPWGRKESDTTERLSLSRQRRGLPLNVWMALHLLWYLSNFTKETCSLEGRAPVSQLTILVEYWPLPTIHQTSEEHSGSTSQVPVTHQDKRSEREIGYCYLPRDPGGHDSI